MAKSKRAVHPGCQRRSGIGAASKVKREDIPVVFRAVNLPPEASIEPTSSVYHIAQKTLTNVAKHTHAKIPGLA